MTSIYSLSRVRKWLSYNFWLPQLFALIGMYALFILAIRLLTLTFITYFTISPTSRFQDISDAFSSNEVSLMGLAALIFVVLFCKLNPLTSTPFSEVITQRQIEKGYLPGFLKGIVIAGGLILAFLLSRTYRYLGYFIQFNEAPIELANIFMRMGALGALAYCEEFLFHFKIPKYIQRAMPEYAAAPFIGILYCGIKLLQFDLGTMHLISLFLVSICLYYRALNEGSFVRGAGVWSAILIVFHPLLSLPIFGNNFSGILLLKYQPNPIGELVIDNSNLAIRLLTGGAAGPLSSFAFQLLLIIDIGLSILKRKRLSEMQRKAYP